MACLRSLRSVRLADNSTRSLLRSGLRDFVALELLATICQLSIDSQMN